MAQHPSKPPPQEDDPQGYWEERAQQNATKVYRYSQRKAQLVTRWFGRAAREMDKRIVGFYKQYAEKEQLTLPQAKIALADRKALELTLEAAQALSELYPEDADIRQLLDKVYFARAISRQEFLKLQLNTLAGQLYGDYSGELHRTLTEVFEESYYKSRFDLQQFVGFGSAFNRISTHQIEAAVTTAWKGKNYSERLWGDHRATLARYINRIVTNGFIEGSSGGMMRAELQKAMSMSAYEARRLIRTESCQVSNRANLLAYQENGTEQFQFLATLDMKTSELCREMDGKTFLVADGKPGINLPPLHPFCRSTTVPYLPNAEFDSEDTRTARNPTGEVYTVPADMTYRQWHDRYVSGNPVQQLAEQKFRHGRADAAQYEKYTAVLGKDAPKTFDDFQNIKYTDDVRLPFMELDYKRRHKLQLYPELALPMANDATAAESKFTEYLFAGTHTGGLAKGQAITHRLGYDIDNWHDFHNEILRKVSLYPASYKGKNPFGNLYEQKMVIDGLLGTPANVIVGWINDADKTRLTSAYIKEVK